MTSTFARKTPLVLPIPQTVKKSTSEQELKKPKKPTLNLDRVVPGFCPHEPLTEVPRNSSSADEIFPGLWLGSENDLNLPALKNLQATLVISVLKEFQSKGIVDALQKENIKHLHISINDVSGENIKCHFHHAIDLIESELGSKGVVFIHCKAGISRSPTIVMAYLMKTRNLTSEKAAELVKSKRSIVDINLGFDFQLEEFESELGLNK